MEDRSLYIKIAHWYYTLGLTQDEIAKRLGTTRQRVNRIINSLLDLGIVTITVNGFNGGKVKEEAAIEEHYGLRRVIIAKTYGEEDFRPALAERAARYLEEEIGQGMTIGVSWGETLAGTISRLSYMNRGDCRVVQMVGAQNIDVDMVKSDEIARILADKLDCVSYMLYAPAMLEKEETKKLLMEERTIRHTFEIMRQCDMALFGIGQLSHNATMYSRGIMWSEDIDRIRGEGFVGDLCINPIRQDGSYTGCTARKRFVSANMDLIKSIPNVTAIAGGLDKVEAIMACLNSGAIDTLILDDCTASAIVSALSQNSMDSTEVDDIN